MGKSKQLFNSQQTRSSSAIEIKRRIQVAQWEGAYAKGHVKSTVA